MRLAMILLAALAAITAPASARETRVVQGITYETYADFADITAREGAVRLLTGGALVTVTPGGTFVGVGRIAGRPRQSLTVDERDGALVIAVDGVVVWQGPQG